MMKKTMFLIAIAILFNACRDWCKHVDVRSICGVGIGFEILNDSSENVFIADYAIDSLQVLDSLNNSIAVEIDTVDNTFRFAIFNCREEEELFNQTIRKQFFLKFNALTVDTIHFEFKPIEIVSECGGNDYEFLNITYKGQVYDGMSYYGVNKVYQ